VNTLALQPDQIVRTTSDINELVGEDELVDRARTDSGAFGQLFELYYEKILTYAFRCTLNFAVAEELTSNTFFNALRGLPKYRRCRRLGFSKWLYRIATNEIRMHWRKQGRRHSVSLRFDAPEVLQRTCFDGPEIHNEEAHREKIRLFSRLHAAVAKLPERYRSAINLRFFEGLRYDEVADVLGKRTGTVKSLVHRGVRRLEVILEQDATFNDWSHLNG